RSRQRVALGSLGGPRRVLGLFMLGAALTQLRGQRGARGARVQTLHAASTPHARGWAWRNASMPTRSPAMTLFRNLLLWLVLALAGALLAQLLLAQDPGYVLVRWHGYDYTTTVLVAVALLFAGASALWLLWALLSMPFRAWGRHRDGRARARIGEGFEALHQGHWARAEKLLLQAAEDERVEAAARTGAAQAALARGDTAAARAHLEGFGERHPASRAIAGAELALRDQRPTDALVALDAP